MNPKVDTATAYDKIRSTAQDAIERERLDPAAPNDRQRIVELIETAVAEYQRNANLAAERQLDNPESMLRRVSRSIMEYGPLTALFARSDVEEIFIEGANISYISSDGALHGVLDPTSSQENLHAVEKLLQETNKHLSVAEPLVQARVLDGTARLTGSIPPVSEHVSVTIRRSVMKRIDLPVLLGYGSLTPQAANFLKAVMQNQASVLLSGRPGCGKTAMLSALIAAIPTGQCIRVCEESRELSVPIPHGGYLEARPPSIDGSGEISLRRLLKHVLAMRPHYIVVGEVRGEEAFELVRAVNAGLGFACTVHANSATEALDALMSTAIMAAENVNEDMVKKILASGLRYVVHLDLDEIPDEKGVKHAVRETIEVAEVVPDQDNGFKIVPIFLRNGIGQPLEWTGHVPREEEFVNRKLPGDVTLRKLLEGRAQIL